MASRLSTNLIYTFVFINLSHANMLKVYFQFTFVLFKHTVDFSRMRNQIVGCEGDHADHLATAQSYNHVPRSFIYQQLLRPFQLIVKRTLTYFSKVKYGLSYVLQVVNREPSYLVLYFTEREAFLAIGHWAFLSYFQQHSSHQHRVYLLRPIFFDKMGQSRPLFVYFRLFHITQFKKLMKAQIVCLGLKPGAAGWKGQTNPRSYGSTPMLMFKFWFS